MSTKKLQILSTLLTTDETLTQSGLAADAKVVGDALDGKVSYEQFNRDGIIDAIGYTPLNAEDIMLHVSYDEIKNLIDTSALIPGMYYRITDYITTTIQENTQSAGHPFDIVVQAISENALAEKATAVQRDGDEYFANSAMSKWELWYTTDNDTTRFAWADEVNGKGVIYRMIDEHGNECPYDFKNIQMQDALDTTNTQYYYTFDTNGVDLSLDGSNCFDNVIKKYVDGQQRLNRIIFIARQYKNVNNNFFDVLCYNNTLDGSTRNLRFEHECYGNKFGFGCTTSNFGTKFRNNVVGSEVQSINVGKGASNNVFCSNIYYSTFGTYFRNNVVCTYLYYSTFGHYVQNCILGESAENPGKRMRYLTFENNVQYANLYKMDQATTQYMQNVKICSGMVGTSSARVNIEVEELAQEYTITYATNANGELQKYCEADHATKEYVKTQIDSIPTPDVSGQILEHNTSTDAHQDIRNSIAAITPESIGAQVAGNYLTVESDPTVPAWAKASTKPSYTASEVGADPTGTATSAVSTHNTATDSHNDIRLLIEGLTTRLNTLADSDDTTLDQMSEIVAYIKSNKSLIEDITTNKVNVSDIINNLTTNVTNKPLSAAQGVALKGLIDNLNTNKLDASALSDAVDDALAQAKSSGEFDGAKGDAGVGVSSVKQTTTSTADDGNNVITVTLTNGTTSTFTVQNGSKGSKGDSPVRGTDYWTDADKAEIKSYVDEAILGGAW